MTWTDNVERLAENIREAIKRAKAEGTVGMSSANLKQIVSTNGITFPNANAFHRGFDEAVKTVRVRGFSIY
jgi:hypothetical protein